MVTVDVTYRVQRNKKEEEEEGGVDSLFVLNFWPFFLSIVVNTFAKYVRLRALTRTKVDDVKI